jgi:beta-glucanase (GH16 family)
MSFLFNILGTLDMKRTWILLAVCLPLAAADWKLVWSDEFDKDGAPDPAKWTYEEGLIRNRELQYYTADRRENARVEGGHLVVEARRETWKNAEYTSASVITKGKAEWQYGRIEVRAKLPGGRGTWPAIWMMPNVAMKWPDKGEIDIMENVGFEPDVIHANIHTQAYNHVKRTNKGAKTVVEKPDQSFHVYALEWTPEKMDFFVDKTLYFSYANEKNGPAVWPFDKPFYLILNVAVGGAWGGQKGVDASAFPRRMEVDYVRVYQR